MPAHIVAALLLALVPLSWSRSGQAAPLAYVGNGVDDGALYVINTETSSVVTTIPVGSSPWGIAVNPTGTRVYVTNHDAADNTVSVIDTHTNSVIATVPVGLVPFGVAVNPTGTRVYVGNWFSCATGGVQGDSVSVIDATTNSVIAEIRVATRPWSLALTPDGTRLYVTNNCGDTRCGSCEPSSTDTVSVIDTSTNTVIDTLSGIENPSDIVVSPDGTRAYVANGCGTCGSGVVSVLDTTSNVVVASVPVPSDVGALAVHPTGSRLYASLRADISGGVILSPERIAIIDTASNTIVDYIEVSGNLNPAGLSIAPDGKDLYVASDDRNVVAVIDTRSNTVVTSVTLGDGIARAFGDFIGPASFPDADGDGSADATDRCPDTPNAEMVDDAGCSRAQFCALLSVTTRDGARACKRADWRNDAPLMKRSEADCTVDKGARGHEDDRCVPAVP